MSYYFKPADWLLSILSCETFSLCYFYTSGTSSDSVPSSLKPNENVQLDLRQQLRRNLKKIGNQYAAYISCICTSLKAKRITTKNLSTYLLKLPALQVDTDNQQHKLLAGLRTELKKAKSINDIVDLLDEKHTSFLDCEIFQGIVKFYKVNVNQTNEIKEILKYPEHLKAYVEMHKLSEFIKINPELSKFTCNSEKLTLKFEIDLSRFKLADLIELRSTIADILEVQPSTLRLLRIEEGCMVTTFLIPSSVAHFIFPTGKMLTAQQMRRFHDLSALWLKCCGFSVDFDQR